jgi:hypothetical protein
MGMETLKNAERAAGFAMASSDDLSNESQSEVKAETAAWRPGEAMLLQPQGIVPKAAPSIADWVKGLFGMSGRGAPA